eukprot:gnl/MRDRNA2_/MRDRNA2_113474_c0_seq1.p1 gnl/MRDRNA2_/MRDRNA2_113474_c0~~gnl/MRDRNA2_/MRDRNA2_113474_c0_seq1.p1  ORF type:complete len:1018 (-),score=268.53 gnl/MRDRNA2_/MRDRNA2_113474_c0_seq1:174-3227(-)
MCEAVVALRYDLYEAEEARRVWRVRCIQAEAELRALQARHSANKPIAASSNGDGTHRLEAGAGDTGGAAHAEEEERWLPKSSAQDAAAGMSPLQVTPGQDLIREACPRLHALEAHVAEMTQWSEMIEQKASAELAFEATCASRLNDEEQVASRMESDCEAFERKAFELIEEIVHPDWRLSGNVASLQMDISRLETTLADSANIEALAARVEGVLEDLRTAVQHQEEARDSAHLHRDSMLATVEEARSHAQSLEDEGQYHTKEAAAAKRAAVARGKKLTQLQTEVQKERKIVQKRQKALESAVEQHRKQLEVAEDKVHDTSDQMQRLQQRNMRQLSDIKKSTQATQEEVIQARNISEGVESELRSIRTAEDDLQRLTQQHQASLEAAQADTLGVTSELGHVGEEFNAIGKAWSSTEAECQAVERIRLDTVQQMDKLKKEEAGNSARLSECEEGLQEVGMDLTSVTEAHRLREIIRNEFQESFQEVASLEDSNARLKEQNSQLRQGQQLSQKEREKHLLDLQEAVRRAAKLRDQHYEMMKNLRGLRAKGKDAVAAAAVERLGALAKKLEGLLLFLEGSARNKPRVGAKDQAGADPPAPSLAASQQRNQERRLSAVSEVNEAAMQRRLSKDRESFSELLEEEKRKVSWEQRKISEATSSHSLYLSRANLERSRDMEECKLLSTALVVVRDEEAQQKRDLESALMRALEEEAKSREETISNFQAVLHCEDAEQHAAQENLEQFSETVRLLNQRPIEDEPSLRQRLANTEAETEELRAESRHVTDRHTELLAETVQRQRAYRECMRKVRRMRSEAMAKLVADPPLVGVSSHSRAGSSSYTPSRPESSDCSRIMMSPVRPVQQTSQRNERRSLTLPVENFHLVVNAGHLRSASSSTAANGSIPAPGSLASGLEHRRTNSARIAGPSGIDLTPCYTRQDPLISPRETIMRHAPSNDSPPRQGLVSSPSQSATVTPRSTLSGKAALLVHSSSGRHLSPTPGRVAPLQLAPGGLPLSPDKRSSVTA